jgi:hypothetical protein
VDSAVTSFILGYHGCDRSLAERMFAGTDVLRPSNNDYDWLADGIYFWEHNVQRAYQFASELRDRPRNDRQRVIDPAVVGCVIELGSCLNLLDGRFIELVRVAHADLVGFHQQSGTRPPSNTGGPDLLRRELDCEVIRTVHLGRKLHGDAPFDTVRAAFVEGGPLYENAGFAAKNHIQVCVRNPAALKGYFRPLGSDGWPMTFGGAVQP